MPFISGTVIGQEELLLRLREFAKTTLKWTELRWQKVGERQELWIQGPGAGADQPVTIGFLTNVDVGVGAYGIEITSTITYDNSAAFHDQPNRAGTVWMNLWPNNIPYWFYGNPRRIIAVAKCDTSYISSYVGMFLPYALPEEFKFPVYIGGNYGLFAEYNLDNAGNRCIADPGKDSAYYHRRAIAGWEKVFNQGYESQTSDKTITTNACLWPSRIGPQHYYRSRDWSNQAPGEYRPNVNGEMPLWQCQLLDAKANQFVGALDGVFYTPGFGRVAEQQITGEGGRTFRIFQNIARTSGRDYFAIEEK